MKKAIQNLGASILGLLAKTTSGFACGIIVGEVEMPKSLIR